MDGDQLDWQICVMAALMWFYVIMATPLLHRCGGMDCAPPTQDELPLRATVWAEAYE